MDGVADTKEIARLIANAERPLEKLDVERKKVTAELEELRHKQNSELQVRESTPSEMENIIKRGN